MLDLGSTLTIATPGALAAAGLALSDPRVRLTDTVLARPTGSTLRPPPSALRSPPPPAARSDLPEPLGLRPTDTRMPRVCAAPQVIGGATGEPVRVREATLAVRLGGEGAEARPLAVSVAELPIFGSLGLGERGLILGLDALAPTREQPQVGRARPRAPRTLSTPPLRTSAPLTRALASALRHPPAFACLRPPWPALARGGH